MFVLFESYNSDACKGTNDRMVASSSQSGLPRKQRQPEQTGWMVSRDIHKWLVDHRLTYRIHWSRPPNARYWELEIEGFDEDKMLCRLKWGLSK